MSVVTSSEIKRLFDYNQETGYFTRLVTVTYNAKKGTIAGCKNNAGYMVISVNGRLYLSHRLAWLYMHGSFPESQIDHINHIRDDNRIANLRPVSNEENHKNASISKSNKSGVTGVSWGNRERKWRAVIDVKGKQVYLGVFNCVTAAAISRKQAEKKYGFHKNHGSDQPPMLAEHEVTQ